MAKTVHNFGKGKETDIAYSSSPVPLYHPARVSKEGHRSRTGQRHLLLQNPSQKLWRPYIPRRTSTLLLKERHVHLYISLLCSARPGSINPNGYCMVILVLWCMDHLLHCLLCVGAVPEEEKFQASSGASRMASSGKSVAVGSQALPNSVPPCQQIRASHVYHSRKKNNSDSFISRCCKRNCENP